MMGAMQNQISIIYQEWKSPVNAGTWAESSVLEDVKHQNVMEIKILKLQIK